MNRDSKLVEEIHLKCLEILDEFVRVCDILKLDYSLSSGSMLGAVRHKGFIPWDDDIDVAMKREDYDVFLEKAPELLGEKYYLQHYSTDKKSPVYWMKLGDRETTWVDNVKDLKHEQFCGLTLDIWPVDHVVDLSEHNKIHKKTKYYNQLRDYYNYNKNGNLFKKVYRFIRFCVSRMVGIYKINLRQDDFNKKSKVGEFTYADQLYRKKMIKFDLFNDLSYIEFEGKQYKCIKNTDEYLKALYGNDYMVLPPENKRKMHFAKIIDLNKSYTEYIKK